MALEPVAVRPDAYGQGAPCSQSPHHLRRLSFLISASEIGYAIKIAALRLFGARDRGRTLLRTAAMQQGLLQIYEDFCMRDASDCEHCLFPSQLAKW